MMAATFQYNIALLSYMISYKPHLKPYWIIDTHPIVPIASSPITNQEVEGNPLHFLLDHIWRKESSTMAVRVEGATQRSAQALWQNSLYDIKNYTHRFPPRREQPPLAPSDSKDI